MIHFYFGENEPICKWNSDIRFSTLAHIHGRCFQGCQICCIMLALLARNAGTQGKCRFEFSVIYAEHSVPVYQMNAKSTVSRQLWNSSNAVFIEFLACHHTINKAALLLNKAHSAHQIFADMFLCAVLSYQSGYSDMHIKTRRNGFVAAWIVCYNCYTPCSSCCSDQTK